MSEHFVRVDCKNCAFNQLIAESAERADVRTEELSDGPSEVNKIDVSDLKTGSEHTPKSYACAIQQSGCPECENQSGGIGVQTVNTEA